LGICQKITILYALKYSKRLPESNDSLKEVRSLFDFRNRLVHPKTRSAKQNHDSADRMRADLDLVSPNELQKVFWRVTGLFEPDGIGEEGS